ncbi:unnamed protein product, partial [Didymodactylos carnosus]
MSFLTNQILFPAPTPPNYSLTSHPAHLIWIPQSDSTPSIPCLYYPSSSPAASVFLIWTHGNGCDIGSMHETLVYYSKRLNIHLLAYEYPSYGLCQGSLSESSIDAHTRQAYLFVKDVIGWPQERILFYGHSVGSGTACQI